MEFVHPRNNKTTLKPKTMLEETNPVGFAGFAATSSMLTCPWRAPLRQLPSWVIAFVPWTSWLVRVRNPKNHACLYPQNTRKPSKSPGRQASCVTQKRMPISHRERKKKRGKKAAKEHPRRRAAPRGDAPRRPQRRRQRGGAGAPAGPGAPSPWAFLAPSRSFHLACSPLVGRRWPLAFSPSICLL